jgi:hypothetical protein
VGFGEREGEEGCKPGGVKRGREEDEDEDEDKGGPPVKKFAGMALKP